VQDVEDPRLGAELRIAGESSFSAILSALTKPIPKTSVASR
jgi:hypothetical protein